MPEDIGKLALFLEQAEVSVCERPRPRGIRGVGGTRFLHTMGR